MKTCSRTVHGELKVPHAVTRILRQKLKARYTSGSKQQKTLMLNAFCAITGLSRKHSIRSLHSEVKISGNHRGAKQIYDSEVQKHLVTLWESCGRLCSKKMVKAIEKWLPFYSAEISDRHRLLLTKMSSSTIDRILQNRRKSIEKGQTTTIPSIVGGKFPIKLLDSPIIEPGFVEADTVAHCGTSLEGAFVNSLTVTDIFSGWTEVRAVWGKTAQAILGAVSNIELTLPFKIKGFASDSGSEFLNDTMWTYFQQREIKISFVRGRPYKKNDTAHVEQKNWTHVRRFLGYDRFDREMDVEFINDLYQNYWLILWNFFTPVMKLKTKTTIGRRVSRVYDEPKTPFDRLIESNHISESEKKALLARMENLNPFFIKAELDKRLKEYFKIVEIREKQSLRDNDFSHNFGLPLVS